MSEEQRETMNNPTSDQIYQNLASRVLTLLLERDRTKTVATDGEGLAISNHETKNATTERDRASKRTNKPAKEVELTGDAIEIGEEEGLAGA